MSFHVPITQLLDRYQLQLLVAYLYPPPSDYFEANPRHHFIPQDFSIYLEIRTVKEIIEPQYHCHT